MSSTREYLSPSAIWDPWFHQTARAGRDTRDTDHCYHDHDDHGYGDDHDDVHDHDHGDDHDDHDHYEDYKHRCDDNNCDDLNKIVEDVENFGRSNMHVRCKGGFHTFHMSPKSFTRFT